MSRLDAEQALSGTTPLGDARRALRVASWTIQFDGLDPATAGSLDRRWGGFAGPPGDHDAGASVRLLAAGEGSFIEAQYGEVYRLEATVDGVISYHLAAHRAEGEIWRAAIAATNDEPRDQILDNLARLLVARLALRAGGLPLHGAGIVIDQRAFIFAGPSRAGKSTAAGLARPDRSLGDDFAVIVPHESGFAAVAVPFDNSVVAPTGEVNVSVPLAGVFRLEHSTENAGIVRKTGALAVASLLGTAAFPSAVPDLAERMLAPAQALVRAGLFGVLSFGLATDVRSVIRDGWRAP